MPALILFGRSWLVASDDLPIPMLCLMVVHTVWCEFSKHVLALRAVRDTMATYPSCAGALSFCLSTKVSNSIFICRLPRPRFPLRPIVPSSTLTFVATGAHQGLESRCDAGKTALAWLFGTFFCFLFSTCLEGLILRQSLKGCILQPGARQHVNGLLYLHFVVTIADVAFTILGTFLDYHVGNSCYVRNHVHTAIVIVIVGNYFIIACNFLGIALIFSVYPDLSSEEKWNRMFTMLGCFLCLPQGNGHDRDSQGSLSHIANCFGEVFQGADLVPSDIAAGLALLALQHRRMLENEMLGRRASCSALPKGTLSDVASKPWANKPLRASVVNDDEITPCSGNIDTPEELYIADESLANVLSEAAHYARWALAAYGWLLYTWANPSGGLALVCSAQGAQNCCYYRSSRISMGGDRRNNRTKGDDLDRSALKVCAGISDDDLFHVSSTNGQGNILIDILFLYHLRTRYHVTRETNVAPYKLGWRTTILHCKGLSATRYRRLNQRHNVCSGLYN